jgi:mannose-6-phosphate isomerase
VTGTAGLPRILPLDNAIRPYAWGSVTAIPELLGIEPSGEPAAELWIGAHPDQPSHWLGAEDSPALDALITDHPEQLLGAATLAAFGPRLPFLLKVLAADKALSIQVHPTLEQAKAGFADEERRGVAQSSPERNYSDANHKPELACALTDFDALCGFRPVDQTIQLFEALDVEELLVYRELLAGEDGLRATFTTFLTLQGPARSRLIDAVVGGCRALVSRGGQWAAAAGASLIAAEDFPGDVGAVLALLLNHVRLAPGEAIFLGAGNVHAYLRGTCVEVLANSDNVLRCGLTPKHIDVPELLRVADFSTLEHPRWDAEQLGPGLRTFEVPVADFQLAMIDLDDGATTVDGTGPSIVLCTEGAAELTSPDGSTTRLDRGGAAFVAPGEPAPISGAGLVFIASTNLDAPRRPKTHLVAPNRNLTQL